MKIKRSAKCSLRFANKSKTCQLEKIISEYGRVVNEFIDQFWPAPPAKAALLKPIVNSVDSWLTFCLRQVAAREAIDMILAVKRRKGELGAKPVHRGKRMFVSSLIASLQPAKRASGFDCWLHLASMGDRIILDIPIKLHKQFHKWDQKGKRLESYIITKEAVIFAFEVETGPKKAKDRCVGIDTGIKALASLSTGVQLGTDIEGNIERIKRCKHGSKGQKRATRALRHRMDEVAREVCGDVTLVVVENLKGITKNKKVKRRLTKNMRRSVGWWNVMYWLRRLQMTCEETNVSFRSVLSHKTSQICRRCGHADRRNRSGEKFLCRNCGHADNADTNAGGNILDRFLTGPYGAGCKPLTGYSSIHTVRNDGNP